MMFGSWLKEEKCAAPSFKKVQRSARSDSLNKKGQSLAKIRTWPALIEWHYSTTCATTVALHVVDL